MSRKSLVPVNVPALASAPTTPTIRTGDLYFNTTDNTLYSYNGTTWAASSGGGGGGGASVTIDGTAPTSPTEGSLWFDSDTGQFFIYYDSYWLEVGAGSSAAPQAIISQASAPADTSALWLDTDEPAIETIPASIVDAKGDIVVATADNAPARLGVGANGSILMANSSAASGLSLVGQYNVAGKNKIINGDFGVNQRNFTTTTTTGNFGFDRFRMDSGDGTVTFNALTFNPGEPSLGYTAKSYLSCTTAGQTLSTAVTALIQKIEDVRSFAGTAVTVSFWAKAAAGTPKIAVEFRQVFGTGGTPSSTLNSYAGQVTLGTTWNRHSVTYTVPSITGSTIGTDNNSVLWLQLWYSSGSAFNSRTGSIGIQNNTIDIWGIQVEAGSVATPFTLAGGGSPQAELALCQRYYFRTAGNAAYYPLTTGGFTNSSTTFLAATPFPVEMRVAPTALEQTGTAANYGINESGGGFTCTAVPAFNSATKTLGGTQFTATGLTVGRGGWARNDNNTVAYLAWSAEL